jgi:RNA polymerase sigma-70 factor (ECF subfamily)
VLSVEDFTTHRPLLFSIAYRMTGSASEAEDIVQESYLRYRAAAPAEIRSAKAYLSTIVTRLSLDYLKSARAQREQYIGPWLPEPLLTADADPELAAVERRETLATAFLVLLESLNPHERAVFLLREVFEYSYDEIGSMLGLSSANCRQIFHRAQAHVAERRPRFEPSPAEQRRLVDRFIQACQRGDMAALTDVLAGDVVAWSDGGGKATSALQPVYGREKVLRFLAGLLGKAPAGLSFASALVNGAPALLLFVGDVLLYSTTLTLADGRIQALHTVLNPDKLAYLRRQLRG